MAVCHCEAIVLLFVLLPTAWVERVDVHITHNNWTLAKIMQLEKLLQDYNRSFTQVIVPIPSRFDWRDSGKVSPVRDQGDCNACYAFAVTGVIESYRAIETGLDYRVSQPSERLDYRYSLAYETGHAFPVINEHIVDGGWLSVQQLIDCSSDNDFVNNACNFGYIEETFKYINKMGLIADHSYPFVGKKSPCPFKSIESNRTFVFNVERIFNASNWQIKKLLLDKGPLIALIDDRGESFRNYQGNGLIEKPKEWEGRNSTPNHALLIVGWDRDNNDHEYWLVKNSWGSRWGLEGYGHIGFNVRGIGSIVYYPRLSAPAWNTFDTFRFVVIPILLTLLIFNLLFFYLVAYFVKLKTIKRRFREMRTERWTWRRSQTTSTTLEDLEASSLSGGNSTQTTRTGSD